VLGRGLPFHWIVDVETKFEPVTVRVKPDVPATTAFGVTDAIAGTGLSIVKVRGLDVPPPGAGVETVTDAVPAVAMLTVVIAAFRLVAET
jgi:hypothetical protein